jgi:hypothetical protein
MGHPHMDNTFHQPSEERHHHHERHASRFAKQEKKRPRSVYICKYIPAT